MDMETTIGIAILALVPILRVTVWYLDKNVRLKYHDQKVGVRTKWWRR